MAKKITSGLPSKGQCAILENSKRENYINRPNTQRSEQNQENLQYKGNSTNNAVFDFMGGYNKTLEENLVHITGGKQTAKKVMQQCHKWISSQNCEIAKYFYNA